MNTLKCCSRGCLIEGSKEEDLRWKAIESCFKMNTFDFLNDIPHAVEGEELVEVRFKNTRKAIYINATGHALKPGDIVAVEASPGHDIGIVSIIGQLVKEIINKSTQRTNVEYKKIYRLARHTDILKWKESILLEHPTMIKARQIATALNLDMKIGDVEYQGDKNKAIFYYIAEERVDFRELIKKFAEKFRVRIEMKQIGARQEAGRIGGIGPCGRKLCCTTWINDFVSVSTNAARHQELSLNPQKLAGQCSKLKCCLNYELDTYIDVKKDFPNNYSQIETSIGTFFIFKTDILKKSFLYSSNPNHPSNLVQLSLEEVKFFISQNKKGINPPLPENDSPNQSNQTKNNGEYIVEQDSLTRFDNKKKPSKRKKKNRNRQ